jgi:hypothetical protein
LRSVFEFPSQEEGGPFPYISNIGGPVGSLQGRLDWELFYLCGFHRAIYKGLLTRNESLEDRIQDLRKRYEANRDFQSDDDEETEQLVQSRIRESLVADESDLEREKHLADSLTVVALWAIAEKNLRQILALLESELTRESVEDWELIYRWDKLGGRYKKLSVNLRELHDFEDAEECRVLNNAIKHAGIVSSRLAQFPFFSARAGIDLSSLDFEMQRYLNGVSNFLGSLIERANELLAEKRAAEKRRWQILFPPLDLA